MGKITPMTCVFLLISVDYAPFLWCLRNETIDYFSLNVIFLTDNIILIMLNRKS